MRILNTLNTQPPSPTSSISQFLSPTSAAVLQPSTALIDMKNLPSVFRPSAPPSTEDPLVPPLASVPIAPPRPVHFGYDLAPPSAPPETIGLTASPGSLVLPAPPRSAVNLPAPSALSGSAFPRLHLRPLSHQRCLCSLVIRLQLGRSSPWLHLGLQYHRCRVDSSAGSPSMASTLSVVPSVAFAIKSSPP